MLNPAELGSPSREVEQGGGHGLEDVELGDGGAAAAAAAAAVTSLTSPADHSREYERCQQDVSWTGSVLLL
eukprot:765307-Hanusia_phi.AAC.6